MWVREESNMIRSFVRFVRYRVFIDTNRIPHTSLSSTFRMIYEYIFSTRTSYEHIFLFFLTTRVRYVHYISFIQKRIRCFFQANLIENLFKSMLMAPFIFSTTTRFFTLPSSNNTLNVPLSLILVIVPGK